jgi:hypothetical protein
MGAIDWLARARELLTPPPTPTDETDETPLSSVLSVRGKAVCEISAAGSVIERSEDRVAVAGPRACNTQQAVSLHAAAPMGAQYATADSTSSIPDAPVLWHATEGATDAQPMQPATPAMTDAQMGLFDKRVARSIWLGYADAQGRAERLLRRDRSGDHRGLCPECTHARPGWRCAKGEAFLADQLQACPLFKEH